MRRALNEVVGAGAASGAAGAASGAAGAGSGAAGAGSAAAGAAQRLNPDILRVLHAMLPAGRSLSSPVNAYCWLSLRGIGRCVLQAESMFKKKMAYLHFGASGFFGCQVSHFCPCGRLTKIRQAATANRYLKQRDSLKA
jgi:hypothetical protein